MSRNSTTSGRKRKSYEHQEERSRRVCRAAASYCLAVCASVGIDGFPKDPKKAIQYYETSATLGNARAQYELGSFYLLGEEVKEDRDKAVRLFRLAANQGNRPALVSLGNCYFFGDGINKDYKEGIRLWRLAASEAPFAPQGTFPAYEPLEEKAFVVANAQSKLATCYERGLGVALDLAEALRLYRLAAMQGNRFARYSLGTFYQNGIQVKKDLNEARQYYYLPPHKGTKKQDRLESLETL
jgi:TPR repeat protein